MKASSGQSFMPDFLASVGMFAVVLSIFLFSWNSVIGNYGDFSESETMRQDSYYTSVFLTSTPGYPEDWNSSNVEIPGFATDRENVIQEEKLDEFSKLDYDRQRRLMKSRQFYLEFTSNGSIIGDQDSLGNEPVAYMPESSDDFTDVKILHRLNDSDLVWDVYWHDFNGNIEDLDDLTARNIYNVTSGEEDDDGVDIFNDMITNLSDGSYGTAIAEDVAIEHSNIDNPDDLKDFVEDGGTYIHVENEINVIEDTFDLDRSNGDENAEVLEESSLLNSSLEEGDTFQFDDADASFSNPDSIYADGTDESTACLACKWDKGDGKLYFIADSWGDDEELLSFNDADESFGAGRLEFGKNPEDASVITPVERKVLVNQSGNLTEAKMKYMEWTDE